MTCAILLNILHFPSLAIRKPHRGWTLNASVKDISALDDWLGYILVITNVSMLHPPWGDIIIMLPSFLNPNTTQIKSLTTIYTGARDEPVGGFWTWILTFGDSSTGWRICEHIYVQISGNLKLKGFDLLYACGLIQTRNRSSWILLNNPHNIHIEQTKANLYVSVYNIAHLTC